MINVNKYFDGKVVSLAYTSAEGKSTIGVIDAGEYEFSTSENETMKVVEGTLHALLPEHGETWQSYTPGQSFDIATGKTFKVKAEGQVSYLCKYY